MPQRGMKIDRLVSELTGNNGSHSQIGGFPTPFGGYEIAAMNSQPDRFELVVKLNAAPFRAKGIEVPIHDVLHVYFDRENGTFIADMLR